MIRNDWSSNWLRGAADTVGYFRRLICTFAQSIFRGTADATRSADHVRKLSRPLESHFQRRERQSLLRRRGLLVVDEVNICRDATTACCRGEGAPNGTFQARPIFALISSTSSSGVRPNSIVSASLSDPGSSKSANWLLNKAGFMK